MRPPGLEFVLYTQEPAGKLMTLLSGIWTAKDTRRNSETWRFFTMMAPGVPKSFDTLKSRLNLKLVGESMSPVATQGNTGTSSLTATLLVTAITPPGIKHHKIVSSVSDQVTHVQGQDFFLDDHGRFEHNVVLSMRQEPGVLQEIIELGDYRTGFRGDCFDHH